jgi:hypothetical protein
VDPSGFSQRPSGARASFLAAYPGLRFAYLGLLSSGPYGTATCGHLQWGRRSRGLALGAGLAVQFFLLALEIVVVID